MGDGVTGHGHFAKQEKYAQKPTGNRNQGSCEDNQKGIGIKRHGILLG